MDSSMDILQTKFKKLTSRTLNTDNIEEEVDKLLSFVFLFCL